MDGGEKKGRKRDVRRLQQKKRKATREAPKERKRKGERREKAQAHTVTDRDIYSNLESENYRTIPIQ